MEMMMNTVGSSTSSNPIGSSLSSSISTSGILPDSLHSASSSSSGTGAAGINSVARNLDTGEDINSLEAEITELQRENARVESQMMRLKSDINAMESQLNTSDRETSPLSAHQQRSLASVTSTAGGTAALAAVSSSTNTESALTDTTANNNNTTNNHGNSNNNNGGNSSNPHSTSNGLSNSFTSINSHLSGGVGLGPSAGGGSANYESNLSSTAPSNINNYYESLRNNVITLLEHVRIPPGGHNSVTTVGNGLTSSSSASAASNQHTAYGTHPSLIPPGPLPTTSIAASSAGVGVSMYGSSMHPLSSVHASGMHPPPPPPHSSAGHHPYTVHHTAGYPHPEPFDSYISKLQSLCVPPDVYALPDDGSRPVYDTVKSSLHQDYASVMPTPI